MTLKYRVNHHSRLKLSKRPRTSANTCNSQQMISKKRLNGAFSVSCAEHGVDLGGESPLRAQSSGNR
jgi:hypothetical protein